MPKRKRSADPSLNEEAQASQNAVEVSDELIEIFLRQQNCNSLKKYKRQVIKWVNKQPNKDKIFLILSSQSRDITRHPDSLNLLATALKTFSGMDLHTLLTRLISSEPLMFFSEMPLDIIVSNLLENRNFLIADLRKRKPAKTARLSFDFLIKTLQDRALALNRIEPWSDSGSPNAFQVKECLSKYNPLLVRAHFTDIMAWVNTDDGDISKIFDILKSRNLELIRKPECVNLLEKCLSTFTTEDLSRLLTAMFKNEQILRFKDAHTGLIESLCKNPNVNNVTVLNRKVPTLCRASYGQFCSQFIAANKRKRRAPMPIVVVEDGISVPPSDEVAMPTHLSFNPAPSVSQHSSFFPNELISIDQFLKLLNESIEMKYVANCATNRNEHSDDEIKSHMLQMVEDDSYQCSTLTVKKLANYLRWETQFINWDMTETWALVKVLSSHQISHIDKTSQYNFRYFITQLHGKRVGEIEQLGALNANICTSSTLTIDPAFLLKLIQRSGQLKDRLVDLQDELMLLDLQVEQIEDYIALLEKLIQQVNLCDFDARPLYVNQAISLIDAQMMKNDQLIERLSQLDTDSALIHRDAILFNNAHLKNIKTETIAYDASVSHSLTMSSTQLLTEMRDDYSMNKTNKLERMEVVLEEVKSLHSEIIAFSGYIDHFANNESVPVNYNEVSLSNEFDFKEFIEEEDVNFNELVTALDELECYLAAPVKHHGPAPSAI